MKNRLSRYSSKQQDRLFSIGSLVTIVALWELTARVGLVDARFFPPPTRIVGAFWKLTVSGDLFGHLEMVPALVSAGDWGGLAETLLAGHLWISLMRIFAGFFVGAIPGLVIGVIMGMSRKLRLVLDPIVSAFYVVPKVTILPFIMLLFGIGETSKVAIVAIAAFFGVLINSMAGVLQIDPIFLQAGKNYGANPFQMFRYVIVPAALPIIFAGLRLSLGTALIVIVSAEFVAARSGLGYLVWQSWQLLFVDDMFVGIAFIMILGILFTNGLKLIEKWAMPWQRADAGQGAAVESTESGEGVTAARPGDI